ncbi:MAG: hypothetical protein AABX37_03010 [Nanoarchaeota archaeon]
MIDLSRYRQGKDRPEPTTFHSRLVRAYQDVHEELTASDPRNVGVDPRASLMLYDSNFEWAVGEYKEQVTRGAVLNVAGASQIVYVGDFHPLRAPKNLFVDIVKKASDPTKKTVLLLEEFTPNCNESLEGFLTGEYTASQIKDWCWSHASTGKWGDVKHILSYAQQQRKAGREVELYGIDARFDSVRMRTRNLQEEVAKFIQEGNHVFVFVGEFHLNAKHLPDAFQNTTSCTILQNPEEMFWQLFNLGMVRQAEAVKTSTNIYCLDGPNPLLRAFAQNDSNRDPRDRDSDEEMMGAYKQLLVTILGNALGESGAVIDSDALQTSMLEQLVYDGSLSESDIRERWRGFFPPEL